MRWPSRSISKSCGHDLDRERDREKSFPMPLDAALAAVVEMREALRLMRTPLAAGMALSASLLDPRREHP